MKSKNRQEVIIAQTKLLEGFKRFPVKKVEVVIGPSIVGRTKIQIPENITPADAFILATQNQEVRGVILHLDKEIKIALSFENENQALAISELEREDEDDDDQVIKMV